MRSTIFFASVISSLFACQTRPLPAFCESYACDPSSTSTDTSTGNADRSDTTTTVGSTGTPSDPSGDSTSTTDAGTSTSASDDGEAATTGESSSTDGLPTSCEGQCRALPPEGWSGPVVLHTSTIAAPSPACEGEWGGEAGHGFANLNVPASTCECSCGEPEGVSCNQWVRVRRYSDANCETPVEAPPWSVNNVCVTLDPDHNEGTSFDLEVRPPSGGACDPHATSTVPEASFEQRYDWCAARAVPAPGDCGDGVACMPATEGPLCIVGTGELECPPGDYTERQVVYDYIDDDRQCASCECGAPVGECVGAQVNVGPVACGVVGPSEILHQGECLDPGVDLQRMRVSGGPIRPETACQASAPSLQGDAVGAGATTLCCEPS